MTDDSPSPVFETGSTLKGVLFDMDGTLISTLPLIFHCVNHVAQRYLGKTLSLEDVIAGFGPPARVIIRNLTSGLPVGTGELAVQDYYSCYRTHCPSKALLFPGIVDLLKKLDKTGRKLAVVTGVERVLMDCSLNAFELGEHFDVLIAGDDVHRSKPEPEGILSALGKMGLDPASCMMVGDSPADIIAGKKAGVLTGAALWSPEGQGDPTKEGPDYKFRSVPELASFLFPKRRKAEPGFFFTRDLR